MRALSFLLIALSAFPLSAQSLDEFEQVLIPAFAYPPVTGLSGSRFAAAALLYAPAGTRYFPRYRSGSQVAEIGTFENGYMSAMFGGTPPSRVGRFLFIERSHSDQTALHAFLDSRPAAGAADHSVRLPVVREHDFRSTTFSIIGVSSVYSYEVVPGSACRNARPLYRHTLRIYDFDGRGGTVRVRQFNQILGGFLFREFTLDLSSREGGDPSFPMYGEIEISELCNPFSCHTPCFGGSQRLEITPITPSLRVWALVSETNNATQEVRLLYAE